MTPAASSLFAWLGSFAALLVITLNALKLADRIRGKTPEPPNQTLDASHRALRERTDRNEASIRKLYERTEQVATSCAKLETSNAAQNVHLARIEAQIESMPDRILTMLRNIRDLGGNRR